MIDPINQPTREFADRATISLLESAANFREFMELVSKQVAAMFDFDGATRANRSFIPPELLHFVTDQVYHVPLRDTAGMAWLYILVEQQSKYDPLMPLRLVSYIVQVLQLQVRLWEDAGKPSEFRMEPVIPVVFYTGKRDWSAPIDLTGMMDITEELREYVPVWKTLLLPLHGMDPDKLKASGAAFAQVLRAWQVCDEPEEKFGATLADVAARLDTLPDSASAQWQRTMLFLHQLVLNKRPLEEWKALGTTLSPYVVRHRDELEVLEMTGEQWLLQQGEEAGIQKGVHRGQRELTLQLLMAKFGISVDRARLLLDRVGDDRISSFAQRLLVVNSVSELDG